MNSINTQEIKEQEAKKLQRKDIIKAEPKKRFEINEITCKNQQKCSSITQCDFKISVLEFFQ